MAAIDAVDSPLHLGGFVEWRVINQKDKGICNIHTSGYWLFGKPPEIVKMVYFAEKDNEFVKIGEERVKVLWPENLILDGKLHMQFIEAVPDGG